MGRGQRQSTKAGVDITHKVPWGVWITVSGRKRRSTSSSETRFQPGSAMEMRRCSSTCAREEGEDAAGWEEDGVVVVVRSNGSSALACTSASFIMFTRILVKQRKGHSIQRSHKRGEGAPCTKGGVRRTPIQSLRVRFDKRRQTHSRVRPAHHGRWSAASEAARVDHCRARVGSC